MKEEEAVRRLGAWRVWACVLVVGTATLPSLVSATGAEASQGSRGYEQVSPVDKHGGDVMAYSPRTRVSPDGDAAEFESLTGFGDVLGTGSAAAYLAQRSPSGWVTHAIMPVLPSGSLNALVGANDAYYEGEFSSDFNRAIFASPRPLTVEASVKDVANLYRRDGLRSPGPGTYDLVTACPLCDTTSTPLAPLPSEQPKLSKLLPILAGASPDLEHVAFESPFNLTSDAPAQPASCGTDGDFFPPSPLFCRSRLYEWDRGTLRLAGILPDGTPADISFAGAKARQPSLTPHVVSDGSDGHSRIFFTQPTDDSGATVSELDPSDLFGQLSIGVVRQSGNVFMRLDHAQTVKLNASERSIEDTFSPAQYLDATPDGRHVFFFTNQALTNDAPHDGNKIYMYDASKPDSAPDNLTLLTPDTEPADGPAASFGMIGASNDGRYVYLIADGQLIAGGERDRLRIYVWHDGLLREVGRITSFNAGELLSSGGPDYQISAEGAPQAAVTPDGRRLVFTAYDGSALGGHDQGTCNSGEGCREVYVYSADTGALLCASCNPSGAPATVDASLQVLAIHGGARITEHTTEHPISDDGSQVFFSSAEALVPGDVNGKSDAYEYDVEARSLRLISSGKDPSDSWFVDASPSGRDVFFVTREPLVGWDRDNAYDLYDARIGGGFPEPVTGSPACSGDPCQGAGSVPPPLARGGTSGLSGAGNLKRSLRRRTRGRRACRHGRLVRIHRGAHRGKRRCVKRRAHRRRAHRSGS